MNRLIYINLILLSAFLGVTSASHAAVTVYFYGINSSEDTNPDPLPLFVGYNGYIGTGGGVNLLIAGGFGDPYFYRADAMLIPSGRTGNVPLDSNSGSILGDQNFAYLNFGGGHFKPLESIAQFYFEADGGVRLVAIATTNTGTTASNILGNDDGRRITVAEGASAIASVPEPTTTMVISVTALGCFLKRRRNNEGEHDAELRARG